MCIVQATPGRQANSSLTNTFRASAQTALMHTAPHTVQLGRPQYCEAGSEGMTVVPSGLAVAMLSGAGASTLGGPTIVAKVGEVVDRPALSVMT